jgi:hypothetical protein
LRVLLIAVVCCLPAGAQILEVTGGQSTLFEGAGAGVTAYLPNSILKLGAGIADGQGAFGLSDTFPWHGYTVTAGDSAFSYAVDNAGGVGIQSRGLSIAKQLPDETLAAFAGTTGMGYSLPFFTATKSQHAGAGFYYRKRAGRWQFSSLEAFAGGQRTAMESAAYTGRWFHLSGASGLLAGQRTTTGVFDAQPVKALHFTAMRQDIFWQGQSATINSANGFAGVGRFTASATALTGNSAGHKVSGQSLGASVRLGAATFRTNLYRSNGESILQQSAAENFRRWRFTQSVSGSGGQHSFAAGAGYQGNSLIVSVDHSVQYLLFGGGFQQVTSVSLSFRVPRTDTRVSLAATMLPSGPPLYTASADSWIHGPLNIQGSSQPAGWRTSHSAGGRYVIRGVIVDRDGTPVSGAAVALGGQLVFSDSTGGFYARYRKQKPASVALRPDEFATPGTWVVISAPEYATPSGESSPSIQIVVEKK